jgi:hypothetical protein
MANYQPKIRLFLSHAYEDKDSFVRGLAAKLAQDFDVWYDEYSLRLGDSLRASISKGLKECDYGVVVLSPDFFRKKWTQIELDGLLALETEERKIILPIWHRLDRAEVLTFFPALAERFAIKSSEGLDEIVFQITRDIQLLQRDRQIHKPFADKVLAISKKLAERQNAEEICRGEPFASLVQEAVGRLFAALQDQVQSLSGSLELRVSIEVIILSPRITITGPLECDLVVFLKPPVMHPFQLSASITGKLSASYAFTSNDETYVAFPADNGSVAWKSLHSGALITSEVLAENLISLYLAQMERMA